MGERVEIQITSTGTVIKKKRSLMPGFAQWPQEGEMGKGRIES